MPSSSLLSSAAAIVAPRYAEAHRHYHAGEHLAECLAELAGVRHLCRDPLAVELAILFHDAVYDPRRADNEERSADLAAATLRELGAEADLIARVRELVLHTQHRVAPPEDDPDARLLVDIDLAILAREEERFDRYEADVRREYAHVPDDDFRAGRAAVLRAFLARPAIYLTPSFRAREPAARRNLRRSLDRLASSRPALPPGHGLP